MEQLRFMEHPTVVTSAGARMLFRCPSIAVPKPNCAELLLTCGARRLTAQSPRSALRGPQLPWRKSVRIASCIAGSQAKREHQGELYPCMVRKQAAFHSALVIWVSRSQNPMQSASVLPPPPCALGDRAMLD